MRLKKITFEFPESLETEVRYQNQMVKRFQILDANSSGIREKLKGELSKVLKATGLIKFINPNLFAALQYRIEGMNSSLSYFFDAKIDPLDPRRYLIVYAMDSGALLTIKGLGEKLKFLGVKDKDLIAGQILSEKKLTDGFKKFVFPDMGIQAEAVKITIEEIESEPVSINAKIETVPAAPALMPVTAPITTIEPSSPKSQPIIPTS